MKKFIFISVVITDILAVFVLSPSVHAAAVAQATIISNKIEFQLPDNVCVGPIVDLTSMNPPEAVTDGAEAYANNERFVDERWDFGSNLLACGPRMIDGILDPYSAIVQSNSLAYADPIYPYKYASANAYQNVIAALDFLNNNLTPMTLDFTIHGLIDLFAQVVNINGSSVAIGEIDFIISEGDNRLETNVIPLTVVPNNGRFLQEKTVNISQKIPAGKTIIPPLGAPYIEPGTFSIYLRDYTYAYAIGSRTVPEPTSTLSLLAFGTLGAASTLKRKLKSSRSSEKETTQVS